MINDYNLKIKEKEYRDIDLPSYSMLSSISKLGIDVMSGVKNSGGFSFKFGSLVDDMCFDTEAVLDKYYCQKSTKIPTKNVKDIIDLVLADIYLMEQKKEIEDVGFDLIKIRPVSKKFIDNSDLLIHKRLILKAVKKLNVYTKYSEEKILETVVRAGNDYFRDNIDSRGKVSIKRDMWDKAMETANTLATHKFSRKYFEEDYGIELIYQFKFKSKVNGHWTKGMLDIVLIDHNTKKIYPVDLKTGDLPADKFSDSFLAYGYYIQASLYREALRQIVKIDKDLEGYTVEEFEFLYISKENIYKPIVWIVSEKIHNASLVGFTDIYGIKHKGVYDLLKEYDDCKKGMYCSYTEDTYKNEGRVMFDEDLIKEVNEIKKV